MKSVLKALAICGAGGVLFSVLRAPLPWMLGLCLPWPLENSWAPISLRPKGPSDRTAHHRLRAWLVLHTGGRPRGRGALVSVDRSSGFRASARVRKWMVPHAQHRARWDDSAFCQRSRRSRGDDYLGERFGARLTAWYSRSSLRVMIVVVVVPFLFTLLGVPRSGRLPRRPQHQQAAPRGLHAGCADR